MTLVEGAISFVAKAIAIIRLSATGGGHFEFFNEKVNVKMETVFSVLWDLYK